MHLAPRDLDKLVLHQAGSLAQKRLARGTKLNHPEAVALIATQLLELIRDGRSVAELMSLGRHMLGRRQVMAGVPELIAEVQVEGTFKDGTKLVTVHDPIVSEDGDLALALYGSFLPVPDVTVFGDHPAPTTPGAVEVVPGTLTLNEGRPSTRLSVTNLADRPIQVGSHYHFAETNPYLRFDRQKAYGKRLDIAAGTAVRFEPGETKSVELVEIAGNKIVRGGNALAEGPVNDALRQKVPELARSRGFAHQEEA